MSNTPSYTNQNQMESRENIQEISRSRTINSLSQLRSEGRNPVSHNRWLYNRSMLASSSLQHNTNTSLISEGEQSGSGYIWGTRFNVDEGKKKIESFIFTYNPQSFLQDSNNGPSYYFKKMLQIKETDVYFLVVDAKDIHNYDVQMYLYLTKYPAETILLFDQIVNKIYASKILDCSKKDSFEEPIRTRVINLKQQSRIRDLKPKNINNLVQIKGLVIRVSSIYPEMKEAYFQCSNCKNSETKIIERGRVEEPLRCKKCEFKGTFEIVHNSCIFADKQYIKIQEKPDEIPAGETPVNVNIVVYDDLVDECKPGDLIEVIGIYRAQPIRVNPQMRILKAIFNSYIDVVSICYSNKQKVVLNNEFAQKNEKVSFTPSDIKQFKNFAQNENLYDILLNSLAPFIHELQNVKMGLLCQLFGGTPKNFERNLKSQFRNEINILLIGDPSTAKSQLLTYINKLTPRGVYTSGKGSSTVGLTAYVSKDPETKEIILESGALVLSDRGICCIDEFDKMNHDTQSILHEVMEQQTISIAKAGIVCTLNARTAILAAANPKESRYNPRKSIVYNIQMTPSLLSRFDLIYLMLDKPDEENDRNLGTYLVSLFSPDFQMPKSKSQMVTQEFLTKYITYAREYCKPNLTVQAEQALVKEYLEMRKMGSSRNTVTATPRQLESMIRIAEAHAKMKLSNLVDESDVRIAANLIRNATQQAAIDPITGQIDINIISTGYSSTIMKKIYQITNFLKHLLKNQEEKFLKGYQCVNLKKDLLSFHEKEIGDLSDLELLKACRNLEEENLVVLLGNTHNFNFYIKKIHH